MQRAGWRIEGVARRDRSPVESVDDGAVQCGRPECLGREPFLQSDGDLRTGISVEDQPSLVLAAIVTSGRRAFVVGMDLNGKTLGREEIFHQQRIVAAPIALEPNLAQSLAVAD